MITETRYFGFGWFRFVVAAILLLAAGLKAYQIATAPLPPVVQGSIFTPLLEPLNNRYFLMVVVVGEILFAMILIAGVWRKWIWLLSLFCFSAFAVISLMKGLGGESSCGCFGTVTINPWITASFDLFVVALLSVFRDRSSWIFELIPASQKSLTLALIAWMVLAGPALYAMLSLKQQAHASLGTEFIGPDGKQMILLEPETWVGKELPLTSRFVQPNDSDQLKHGEWNLLLIHTDCPKCLQMMADLEARRVERVAIVVVPSHSTERNPRTPFPLFTLDAQNAWFVTTPCVVTLSEGVCIASGDDIAE